MKLICLIILATCGVFGNRIAQAQCSLSDVFEKVNHIDFQESRSLTFKKYAAFDFAKFLPIEDRTSDKEFEVGISSTGEIREITYIGKSKFATPYKLIVFNFQDYRVSVLKHLVAGKFQFTPIALVTMKAKEESYAINFSRKFGKENACCDSFYYQDFPVSDLNNISLIMLLDKKLFPKQIIQMSSLQVVISSEVDYEKGNPSKLRRELANFFLSPDFYVDLKINPGMCMSEIFRVVQVPSDLVVEMVPHMHGFEETPLWMFGGAVDYKKCGQ